MTSTCIYQTILAFTFTGTVQKKSPKMSPAKILQSSLHICGLSPSPAEGFQNTGFLAKNELILDLQLLKCPKFETVPPGLEREVNVC